MLPLLVGRCRSIALPSRSRQRRPLPTPTPPDLVCVLVVRCRVSCSLSAGQALFPATGTHCVLGAYARVQLTSARGQATRPASPDTVNSRGPFVRAPFPMAVVALLQSASAVPSLSADRVSIPRTVSARAGSAPLVSHSCIAVLADLYLVRLSFACCLCVSGFAAKGPAAVGCQPCKAGFTASTSGAAECTPCPQVRY